MASGTRSGERHLAWVQPSFRERRYELHEADAAVLATLVYEPAPAISWEFTNPHPAQAVADEVRWRFTVSRHGLGGFFGLSAAVHVSGTHEAVVHLGSGASKGTLEIEGGTAFHWDGKLIRGSTSVFSPVHAPDTPLLLFRSGVPADRITTRVELTAEGQRTREWPLLAALGFYLRMLISRTWR